MSRTIVFAYHTIGARALAALLGRGEDVVAVVTHADDPREGDWFESVAGLARAHGLPCLTPSSPNLPEVADSLRPLAPDLVLSVWYRRLLGPALWTRVSRSPPAPVAMVTPRPATISCSVPGRAACGAAGSGDPPQSQSRARPSPTKAPGNGCVTARIMLAIRAAGHVHSTRPSSGRRRGTSVARA